MQQQIPSPPITNPHNEVRNPPAAAAAAVLHIPSDDPTSSSLFDWSDFLDFNLDESLNPSLNHSEPGFDTGQPPESSGRLRKRDPRLVCSNYLAGRIPCACPELDAQLQLEEESGIPGKKRPRTARGAGGAPARCQVPGCEVDISELKGYHKRHRVCLQCANASTVVLDEEIKRYCQQCGKFHILSDFDEDKRSCRRKLERHNNRRRRKTNDSKDGPEKELQQTILVDDLSGDDDAGKDGICVSSQNEEKEILLESVPALGSQNLLSDSFISFATSGETHIEGDMLNPKLNRSPSYCDNKSSYSSPCPAGRISFKLYDWNPAEFPRRLRLQIFQWLASMPVELEGYIRPGCTILTAFIAMPRPQWHKLMDEPSLCIKDLVASPGSLLSGRGTMHVYLNDMIFLITKDATSVLKVKVNDQAPKLHYIFPNCFEAGRPMEFVACGTHLLQPNFRFLISVSGRYLAYDIRISSLDCEEGHASSANHQFLKIYVPKIDVALSGPAFIEVENLSGLSNFIPVLIGDKETCAEMEVLQQKIDPSLYSNEHKLSFSRPPCEGFASKQKEISELVLDVAWLLKKPLFEQQLSSQIQRLNYLLEYLIAKGSSVILEKLVCSLRSAIDKNLAICSSDSETSSLLKNMGTADRRLVQKLTEEESLQLNGNRYDHTSQNDNKPLLPATNQGLQRIVKNILGLTTPLPDKDAMVPLLNKEVIMNVNLEEKSRNFCNRSLTRTFFTSRPLIMAIMAFCVCSGVCAVVLHPQRIDQIATTIHRCLFDKRTILSFSP